MGNILQEALAEDGIEIVSELGDSVTWNGDVYDALVGDPDVTADLDTGGFSPTGDFQIKILRTAFGDTLPVYGDTVTYNEEEYVVVNHPNKINSAFIVLDIATNA